MTYLKKTAVAVLALGSSAVFAGTMGPVCTANPVTVPCETIAWDFGGKALYLQSIYSGDYGYNRIDTSTNATHYSRANNKWGWGFMIEGSYHFSTGNDLNVNWYHFSKNNHDNVLFFGDNRLTGVLAFAERPRWDAVNIEFGQHVDFGEFKDIRFHAGGQFARVNHQNNLFINDANWIQFNEKFNGFGARTGADMAYNFGNGFAIYGNAAAALLIGTSSFSDYAVIANVASGQLVGVTGSRRALVPELEAKLGATYTYGMPQGNLILDVGYMWVNYFNVLNNIPSSTLSHSDFGLDGIQFGLKYVGAV